MNMRMSSVVFNCWEIALREEALLKPFSPGKDELELLARGQLLIEFMVWMTNVFDDSVCSGPALPSENVLQEGQCCSDDAFSVNIPIRMNFL